MSEQLCVAVGDYVCRVFYPERLADWAIVVITLVAAIVGLGTLRALIDQNSLAHKEFLLANRPRVLIRRVLMMKGPETTAEKLVALVEFVNTGNTTAIITVARGHLQVTKERAAEPMEYTNWHSTMWAKDATASLEPGESRDLRIETREASFDDRAFQVTAEAQCFILAEIEYLDELGVARTVGCCRKYNRDTRRFELFDDPDYEYAD